MTKKEQKAVDTEINRLTAELRLYKAMRFSPPVEPDIPIPTYSVNGLSRGYTFHCSLSSYSDCVKADKACSSSIFHGDGWDKTSSQQPLRLYSRRVDALRMGRHQLALACAEKLARVDEEIDRELKNPSPNPLLGEF